MLHPQGLAAEAGEICTIEGADLPTGDANGLFRKHLPNPWQPNHTNRTNTQKLTMSGWLIEVVVIAPTKAYTYRILQNDQMDGYNHDGSLVPSPCCWIGGLLAPQSRNKSTSPTLLSSEERSATHAAASCRRSCCRANSLHNGTHEIFQYLYRLKIMRPSSF